MIEQRMKVALEQRNEDLSQVRRDLFAAEEKVKSLLRSESSSLSTAEDYAAWDASLKAAGLEVNRLCLMLALVESGGEIANG